MAAWHETSLLAFDVETTGPDPETARVVTAYIAHMLRPNSPSELTHQHLIDPGVEIPQEATEVHGITTAHARQHGQPPAKALEEIATTLTDIMSTGVPLVGMNISFDLTVLDRELRRHGLRTLDERLGATRPVIDILVIDKQVDRFRPGGRKLIDLCRVYGVSLTEDAAHDAAVDAAAAAHVAWKIGERTQQDPGTLRRLYADRRYPSELATAFRRLGTMTLSDLHDAQVRWRAEQVASFAEYRERIGQPLKDADGSWPMRPFQAEATPDASRR